MNRARPRLGVPFEVVLPSGTRRTFRATIVRPLPANLAEAIERGAVDADNEMALCDANVLEGILASLGAIDAPQVPLRCRNCDEDIEVDPARALPITPLLEPLGDAVLDPVMDQEEWHSLEAPLPIAKRGAANRFLLARRTLGDRNELEAILGDEGPLPLGAPLIRALGIKALADGETIVTKSAIAIARALEAIDDEPFADAWDAIARAYDKQHWSPRLLAPVACPKCGARHDVEAVPRPIEWAPERGDKSDEVFPDLDAFTARAAAITREILGDRVYPGLEVSVNDDVPPCDDGGEPLLGSYTPRPEMEGVETPQFVIELFYRTFRSSFDDHPYNVDDEIRETIEHELQHHQYFLDGHDPMDEKERQEIVEERRRIVGGTAATELAAGAGWLASDFGRFVRTTWPVWVIVVFGLLLLLAGDR
jgi:hypothetical protein